MKTHRLTSALTLFCLSVTLAWAQVPQLIHYQGRVTIGGTNFTGAGQFKFALVNNDGTVTFWSNDATSSVGSEPTAAISVAVDKGLYAVLLGDATLPNMTAIPAIVFTNGDVRLRIWFNDGATGSQLLTPDQRIAAVGYALMSANVPDGIVTSNKLADGAVTGAKLANNAVTAGKIAGGAIFATNIANNSVTSNQLADAMSLGTAGISGRLDVYSTSAGTPSVSLFGSGAAGSQISTYGNDGLEQVRLWGGTWGEILLNDDTGNDTTVILAANGNNGGTLSLNHSNSARRAFMSASTSAGELRLYSTNDQVRSLLHGGTDGSYLQLNAADGTTGLYLDGEDGGGGSIGVRNTNGNNRVFIDGQGNNGSGQITVYLGDGDTGAFLGEVSGGSQLYMYNTNNGIRAALDGYGTGGGGQLTLNANDGGTGVNLLGDSGGAGLLLLYGTNGLTRASLDGLGTSGGGQLTLYANDGSIAVNLFGEASTGSHGGELSVNGPSAVEAAQLVGETYGGRLTTKDESANETVLIGSSISTGGFAYFYKANGGIGVDIDGEDANAGRITINGTNGLASITLDGNSSGDGRIICDVLQINGGSDLSEKFDITSVHQAIKPGMIVSIDPNKPGDLAVSHTPFDRTVAGVISGAGGVKPGMLMGQAGTKADGQHPVALTGRVYCYVDADAGGAIEPGDMITTSSTPGHGMKVTDHPKASGAIIGKAMSRLSGGKGLVLVLVSLQ